MNVISGDFMQREWVPIINVHETPNVVDLDMRVVSCQCKQLGVVLLPSSLELHRGPLDPLAPWKTGHNDNFMDPKLFDQALGLLHHHCSITIPQVLFSS